MSESLLGNVKYLKYVKEFERNILRINYGRLLPIATIIYCAEWVIFYFDHLFYDIGPVVLHFQIFGTILIPIMFFTYKRFDSVQTLILKIISYLYIFGLCGFGAFIVYATRAQADLLHVFLIMILGAGALVYTPPKESLAVVAITIVLFIRGLFVFNYNTDIINVYAANTIIAVLVIYFVSVSLYVLKVKDLHLEKELKNRNKLLEEKSKIDQMTGLYTHTEILDILSNEIERARRHCVALSVLLMDLDDFKGLNDRYGHLFGDAVIIKLSKSIRDNIRVNDCAGRYGGDEFLILLPFTDAAGAEDLYGRISDELLQYGLMHHKKITISAGIIQHNGETAKDLLKKADDRLYLAKRSQKSTCVFSDS